MDFTQGEVFQFPQECWEIFPNKYITMIYVKSLKAEFTVFRENWYKMHRKIAAWREPPIQLPLNKKKMTTSPAFPKMFNISRVAPHVLAMLPRE